MCYRRRRSIPTAYLYPSICAFLSVLGALSNCSTPWCNTCIYCVYTLDTLIWISVIMNGACIRCGDWNLYGILYFFPFIFPASSGWFCLLYSVWRSHASTVVLFVTIIFLVYYCNIISYRGRLVCLSRNKKSFENCMYLYTIPRQIIGFLDLFTK